MENNSKNVKRLCVSRYRANMGSGIVSGENESDEISPVNKMVIVISPNGIISGSILNIIAVRNCIFGWIFLNIKYPQSPCEIISISLPLLFSTLLSAYQNYKPNFFRITGQKQT